MDPFILIASLVGGVAVIAALGGAYYAFTVPREQVLDRLQPLRPVGDGETPARSDDGEPRSRFFAPVIRFAVPQQGDELSKIRAKLSWAGYRGARAVETFYLTKLMLALSLAGSIVLVNSVRANEIPKLEIWAVLLAAVGFYAPNVWLSRSITERQSMVNRSLPDALDLLVTCVEAGLGLEAALRRITDEMAISAPILCAEFRQTQLEVQAGMSRSDAFRRLAERTGVEELRILSATLIQTEMFGTSVAKALRVHSQTMRTRRTHRAEERAATVSVKLLLPLIFFILPSLFSVILGPAIVRVAHTLLPTMGQKK